MTEVPSENIILAILFLGSLFCFMIIICKSKSQSVNETDETITPTEAISETQSADDNNESISAIEPTSEPEKIDDLKVVEGIGPKIESILHAAGITSMRTLANSETDLIRKILDEAGPRFRMHQPKTWSTQAKLIADENWDELKDYQAVLNGGRTS